MHKYVSRYRYMRYTILVGGGVSKIQVFGPRVFLYLRITAGHPPTHPQNMRGTSWSSTHARDLRAKNNFAWGQTRARYCYFGLFLFCLEWYTYHMVAFPASCWEKHLSPFSLLALGNIPIKLATTHV